MNVLMVSLDEEILRNRSSDTRDRHMRYAEAAGALHVIVPGAQWRDNGRVTLGACLHVYPLRTKRWFSYVWRAYGVGRRICEQMPIDLITTQDPFGTAFVGWLLKERFSLPLEVQNHSSFFGKAYWLGERPLLFRALHLLGRWLLPRADSHRVINHAERRAYADYGVPPDRVSVIPTPVHVGQFVREDAAGLRASQRATLGLDIDQPVLLWVGRPVRAKRLEVLLEVLRRLRERMPRVILLVVGDLSLAATDPRHVASGLNVAASVRFLGERPHHDLPGLYAAADVYVHTSAYEGLGKSMVEAAAAGLPVVSTDTAGAREIVREGETGFLVPMDDPDLMVARLCDLLANPDMLQGMGRQGRAWVLQRFDRERTIMAVVDAWRAVARTRPGHGTS